jgi:hypothetical protein
MYLQLFEYCLRLLYFCYDFSHYFIGGSQHSIIVTVSHVTSSADYGVLFSIFYFHTFSHDSYMSHYDTLLTRLIHESLCCPFTINTDIGRLGSVASL